MKKKRIKSTPFILVSGFIALILLFSIILVGATLFNGSYENLFTKIEDEAIEEEHVEEVEIYAPTINYEEAVISAVDSANQSVVSIIISRDVPIMKNCVYDPFSDVPDRFRDFFDDGFGQFTIPCDTGETETQKIGGGSGFIISEDGMIITNKHVVSRTDAEYTVFTNDGSEYVAEILARHPAQDIAIIKIDATNLTSANLGDSDSIRLGQTAIAIGNALGEFNNTVSAGVVSGLGRSIVARGSGVVERIDDLIQTDAAINMGNSGGPLLNLSGEVIGINTAVASSAQGIGFAIPINYAKQAIKSVEEHGDILIAFMGVRYFSITPEFAEAQNLPVEYGALVRGGDDGPAVIADSPAMRAGLMAEDIILEINGEIIDKDQTLGNLVQKYNIGDIINVKVMRGEEVMDIELELGRRPADI